jgi:hypothetical protein
LAENARDGALEKLRPIAGGNDGSDGRPRVRQV